MISKAYGFQTGKITLSGLDLAIKLLPDKFYRDDGVVPDLETHTKEVCSEFLYEKEIPGIFKNSSGRTLILKEHSKVGYITFVKKTTELNETYAKGYESGHVLYSLKYQKRFFRELKKRGSKLKKDNYSHDEFAHLCGLYALILGKYNIIRTEFFNTDENLPPENLKKLKKIFIESFI